MRIVLFTAAVSLTTPIIFNDNEVVNDVEGTEAPKKKKKKKKKKKTEDLDGAV